MQLINTMIGWNQHYVRKPGEPWVKAGPHPDIRGWTDPYASTDGACWLCFDGRGGEGWRELTDDERLLRLFVLFAIMTARDGVPPAEAHRAFLEIDEYREAMP